MRLQLLGQVRAGDTDLGGARQRLLLAALALAGGRALSRDTLLDALWEHDPPRTALNVLRTYASRLRAVLPPGAITLVGDGYALSGVTTDAEEFEALAAGRPREALALWRGEALAGLEGGYAAAQRARLEERRLTVLERAIEADLEAGLHAEAVAELRALVTAHPLRERLSALLMLALHRSGRQAEALAVYSDLRGLLSDELGIDPSPELSELHLRVLAGELPPPRTAVRPAQLPADLADFTGRAELVEALAAELAPGAALPVHVIAGIGGVGKTALAVRVAHRVRGRFPDGQLAIDLRGGSDPMDPADALERLLGALGVDGPPAGLADRAALYRSLLDGRRMLVLLDNAASEAQVRPLLPGTSQCAVIVTGRSRLAALAGARTHDLDVLTRPEALSLLGAVAGRARIAAEPEAAVAVAEACAFLPLAVRIAAARLAARPGWNVAVLRDKVAGERRLAELAIGDLAVERTFDLGYDQLAAEQARTFRLLAVADAPDLTLRVAAVVLGVDDPEPLCESLVDLNLLESPAPGRYRYHDLLRVFARSKVADEERDEALARLTGDWLRQVRAAAAASRGGSPQAGAWLAEEAACLVGTLRRHEGEPLPRRRQGSTLAVARALREVGGGDSQEALVRGLIALGEGDPATEEAMAALRI
ncbi:AfsR/SARP family transcriptional regulator [Nonomuraea dietziae]|uniref:AfsR/SARP family transcriptional regulator n=1 Tax=Nonomuraea dietziae TaxID=65515 RepID=UPI00342199F9